MIRTRVGIGCAVLRSSGNQRAGRYLECRIRCLHEKWSMTSQRGHCRRVDSQAASAHCPILEGPGQAELAGSAPSEPPTPANLAKSSTLPRLNGPMRRNQSNVSVVVRASISSPLFSPVQAFSLRKLTASVVVVFSEGRASLQILTYVGLSSACDGRLAIQYPWFKACVRLEGEAKAKRYLVEESNLYLPCAVVIHPGRLTIRPTRLED